MWFIALFISVVPFDVDLQKSPNFVKEYHELTTKKEELNFIEKYKENSNIDIKAYVVSLKMKQAKYKFFPWSKLSVFKREKIALNQFKSCMEKNGLFLYNPDSV